MPEIKGWERSQSTFQLCLGSRCCGLTSASVVPSGRSLIKRFNCASVLAAVDSHQRPSFPQVNSHGSRPGLVQGGRPTALHPGTSSSRYRSPHPCRTSSAPILLTLSQLSYAPPWVREFFLFPIQAEDSKCRNSSFPRACGAHQQGIASAGNSIKQASQQSC